MTDNEMAVSTRDEIHTDAATTSDTAINPLEGVTVLDLGQFLSAPSATLRLADLGARVIKVERPGTGDICRKLYISNCVIDTDSSLFHAINRNKESVAIDLKQSTSKPIIERLMRKANIMLALLSSALTERVVVFVGHWFAPLVRGVLARYLNRQMLEPAIARRAVPMLDVRRDVDDVAGMQLACGLAPFLVPSAAGRDEQHLPSALVGMLDADLIAATTLDGRGLVVLVVKLDLDGLHLGVLVEDALEHLGTIMKRDAHMTCLACAYEFPCLFVGMDEPFVGLDPQASHILKEQMRGICDRGGAIFFSTHVLEVAEKLCDRVAIIKNGRLIRSGTMPVGALSQVFFVDVNAVHPLDPSRVDVFQSVSAGDTEHHEQHSLLCHRGPSQAFINVYHYAHCI